MIVSRLPTFLLLYLPRSVLVPFAPFVPPPVPLSPCPLVPLSSLDALELNEQAQQTGSLGLPAAAQLPCLLLASLPEVTQRFSVDGLTVAALRLLASETVGVSLFALPAEGFQRLPVVLAAILGTGLEMLFQIDALGAEPMG